MKILKILGILALCLFFIPCVYAEDVVDTSEEELVDAGITPDSPIYTLDIFWDQLRLQFTQEAEKRAELELRIAEERLSEVDQMMEEGNYEAAEKSRERYELRLQGLENALQNVKNEQAIERIQANIQKHEQKMEMVQNRFASTNDDVEQIMNQIQNRFEEANEFAEEKQEELKQGANTK